MFTILNRFRGTNSLWAKAIAVILAMLVYFTTYNMTASLLVGFGYLLGESFGWGDWVGTLISDRAYSGDNNEEGSNNGIAFLAGLLYDWKTEWRKFSFVALFIRGIYWWLPTIAPLYIVGIPILSILLSVLFLGIMFPIACTIAKNYRISNKLGAWETQEIYYGIVQDIVFLVILFIGV